MCMFLYFQVCLPKKTQKTNSLSGLFTDVIQMNEFISFFKLDKLKFQKSKFIAQVWPEKNIEYLKMLVVACIIVNFHFSHYFKLKLINREVFGNCFFFFFSNFFLFLVLKAKKTQIFRFAFSLSKKFIIYTQDSRSNFTFQSSKTQ